MGQKRTLQTSSSVGQLARSASASTIALPHASSAMAALEARLATFDTKASPKWPHPHHSRKKEHVPSPADLAAAGFFYAPDPDSSRKKDDRLQHYLCATLVSGWQPGDDPLARLRTANPSCPTVVLSDSAGAQLETEAWRAEAEAAESLPSARWDDPLLFPLSEHMLATRLASFKAIPWPHDPPHARGWKPTSSRLAEAGFHAAHTEEGDDVAMCIYCGRTLSGWEKADDPRAEHLRGERPCPFFAAVLVDRGGKPDSENQDQSTPMASSDTDGPVQVPKAKPNRRQVVSDDNDDDDEEEVEDDGDDDDERGEITQKPRVVSSKSTRSVSSASRTGKKTRAKAGRDEEEDEVDEELPSRPQRAAKASSQAKTRAADSKKAQPQTQASHAKKSSHHAIAVDSDSAEEMEGLSEIESSGAKLDKEASTGPDPELDSEDLVSQELALGKRRAPNSRSASRTTQPASRAASRTANTRQASAARKTSKASTAAASANEAAPAPSAPSESEPEEEEGHETEDNLPVRRRFVPAKARPVSQTGPTRSTRSTAGGHAAQAKAASQAKPAAPAPGPAAVPSQTGSAQSKPLREDKLGRTANSVVPADNTEERKAKLKDVLATYPEDVRVRTERAIEQGMTVQDFLSAEAERALARHAEDGRRQIEELEQQAAKYRAVYERTLRGLE